MDDLPSSELGTQSYWDDCYELEIKNFRKHGDTGEVWFGESIMRQICKWILKYDNIHDCRLIDIGCGNGLLLVELAQAGLKTELTGVDYSAPAIQLAKEITDQLNLKISFNVYDIIEDSNQLGKFDIVHDKGTYDAICLCPENVQEKRLIYTNRILDMLKDNGVFIITSCNWTKDELLSQWSDKFQLLEELPTPQFKFGGRVGNVVTSLVLKKIF